MPTAAGRVQGDASPGFAVTTRAGGSSRLYTHLNRPGMGTHKSLSSQWTHLLGYGLLRTVLRPSGRMGRSAGPSASRSQGHAPHELRFAPPDHAPPSDPGGHGRRLAGLGAGRGNRLVTIESVSSEWIGAPDLHAINVVSGGGSARGSPPAGPRERVIRPGASPAAGRTPRSS